MVQTGLIQISSPQFVQAEILESRKQPDHHNLPSRSRTTLHFLLASSLLLPIVQCPNDSTRDYAQPKRCSNDEAHYQYPCIQPPPPSLASGHRHRHAINQDSYRDRLGHRQTGLEATSPSDTRRPMQARPTTSLKGSFAQQRQFHPRHPPIPSRPSNSEPQGSAIYCHRERQRVEDTQQLCALLVDLASVCRAADRKH